MGVAARSVGSVLGLVLAGFCGGQGTLLAQKATSVAALDLNKMTGTWYQIARLPSKQQKKCASDGTILYALNDKHDTFQRGVFCVVKGGDRDNFNDSGNQDKQKDGKLRIRHWVLFHRPEWVLATDPQFRWALVGSPNHKELWILSRQPEMDPELYARLQSQAAAQGFATAKLIQEPHPKDRATLASPSSNPAEIVKTGTNPAAAPSTTAPASASPVTPPSDNPPPKPQ